MNLAGKVENAGSQHFHLFPWGSQKIISSGSTKLVIVWRIATGRNLPFEPNSICVQSLYHINLTFNESEKDSLLKTLRVKEKMPVSSIFSFSYMIF